MSAWLESVATQQKGICFHCEIPRDLVGLCLICQGIRAVWLAFILPRRPWGSTVEPQVVPAWFTQEPWPDELEEGTGNVGVGVAEPRVGNTTRSRVTGLPGWESHMGHIRTLPLEWGCKGRPGGVGATGEGIRIGKEPRPRERPRTSQLTGSTFPSGRRQWKRRV